MGKVRRGWLSIGVVLVAVLAGCGDDSSPVVDPQGSPDETTDGSTALPDDAATDLGTDDAAPTAEDTGVVITVDGTEYVVDTELGGSCEIADGADTGRDVTAFGFDVTTGQRVELTFTRQSAEFSPSGEEEFYGSLGIASGAEQWQTSTTDPWPFLADGGPVNGTVTMEDFDGQTVEVVFEVDCP